MWQVGIDVGGTFTDVFAYNASSGRIVSQKVPSTPNDPSVAIANGLEQLEQRFEVDVRAIGQLSHGTTVATNALIQRKGGRIALITTRGFGDLLTIGRQVRPRIYDLQADYPDPLVPTDLRFEVAERIGSKGEVLDELTDLEIDRAASEALAHNPDGIAICLLFSFLNPDHEKRIRAALETKSPGLPISTSHEVQPVFREYERFSTTVLNTYLQPVMSHYIHSVEGIVKSVAPQAGIGINQSSGGLMSVAQAARFPVRTALSGPAAGVVGAIEAASRSGHDAIITLDVGGTSTDVCMVHDATVPLAFARHVAGFPIRLPCIDVNAVGAGGGSLIEIGPDGLMTVGPQSAGAEPGAACYGKGGTVATVTDANLILGRLPQEIAGGDMTLRSDLSIQAMQPVADAFGISIEEAAAGALRIVASNMLRAIRAVSVERGHDPRNAVLVPYGGAGGLHAIEVAKALGLESVLVPPDPGILCARGLLVADRSEVFLATRRTALSGDLSDLRYIATGLVDDAQAWLQAHRASGQIEHCLDMRFVGQNYELPIDLPDEFTWSSRDLEMLTELFLQEHERAYGHADRSQAIEIVNMRVTARVAADALGSLELPRMAAHDGNWPERDVWFDAPEPVATKIAGRALLGEGDAVHGPAIIEQADSTFLLWPGWHATCQAGGNLLVEKTK